MTRSKKIRRKFRKFILLGLLTLIVSIGLYIATIFMFFKDTYIHRYIFMNMPEITDHMDFPKRIIKRGNTTVDFDKSFDVVNIESVFECLKYESMSHIYIKERYQKSVGEHFKEIETFKSFLSKTKTTAFIIIKDDKIIYEKYLNGHKRDSIQTSFSIAKVFNSMLIGCMVEDGYLGSIDEPITVLLPELENRDSRFSDITIRHLLTMSSGIAYYDTHLFGMIDLPWDDNPQTYYAPDLRELAINKTVVEMEAGQVFEYNNYNPLLLGLIIERGTGMSVAQYLEQKIWQLAGMEYDASFSLDSEVSGFEKMESGINARAIDFARIGYMLLNNGKSGNNQIIGDDWLAESTSPNNTFDDDHLDSFQYLLGGDSYYKYMWWGYKRDDDAYDFYAAGYLGQYIYISPENNMVIVRNGIDDGDVNWAQLFFEFSSAY